jgi:hypothetical protein
LKLIGHFDKFLENVVNLNQTRIATLEARVESISDFLRNSEYPPKIRRFTPQGSYAHRTIIKPPGNRDYDADLLMVIDRIPGWSAAQYLNDLYSVFREHRTYADMVNRNTRCVVVDYANDFHLDVVPCIQDINGTVRSFWICNRRTNEFEQTAPEQYNQWLSERNTITGGNSLRKSTRLIKFLRDIKLTFSVKSILLTTLLGSQVRVLYPHLERTEFEDVPNALRTLFVRLDDFLKGHKDIPVVSNPVLLSETFDRHSDQDRYTNFRERIHTYREWVDEAYTELNRDKSIGKWRRVFGEDFAEGEVVEKAASVAAVTLNEARASSSTLVARVQKLGRRVLDAFPRVLPHVQPIPWPVRGQLAVDIRATHGGVPFASGEILQKGQPLEFRAHVPTGLPHEFEIRWLW